MAYEFMGWWEDDHLPCYGCKINGVEVGFWWYEFDSMGEFKTGDKNFLHDLLFDQCNREYDYIDFQVA